MMHNPPMPGSPGPLPEERTADKALQLNLDGSFYGTFAEIGAGQEVADWFFRVGGAAGTVAKSMSAYDMVMSDAIYGKTARYVSRERLLHMLDHEWSILLERLGPVRGVDTRFFVFADTVKARGFKDLGECHGWLGVRFQFTPGGPPNDILVHARLLDESAAQQRETLGILGVNLLHAIHNNACDPDSLCKVLIDGLSRRRIEIDMLKCDGPGFHGVDNRLCALVLVERGLADAAMFTAAGEVVQAAEALYKRPVAALRGDFRPPTVVHLDMLEQTKALMESEVARDVAELAELTMHNLLHEGDSVDKSDFLARAQMLQALGKNVMVSNFAEFHRLSSYLSRSNGGRVGLVVGLPLLETLFEEKWYADLEGGALEGFGRFFKDGVTLFVYPCSENGTERTIADVRLPEAMRPLFDLLRSHQRIVSLPCGVPDALPYTPADVRAFILKGDKRWRQLVPGELESSLLGG
jgi:hypothetical protein